MENIFFILLGGAIGYFLKKLEITFKSKSENRILEGRKFLSSYAACIRYRRLLSECLMGTTEQKLMNLLTGSKTCLLEFQTQTMIAKLFFDKSEQLILDEIVSLTTQALDNHGEFILLSLKKAPVNPADFESTRQTFENVLPEKIEKFTSLIAKDFKFYKF